MYALQPVNRGATDVEIKFVIERGDSVREITKLLDNKGLIKAQGAFKLYSFLTATIHRFKPGFYKLSPSWNAAQIIRLFVAGTSDIKVVIKEGATVRDIDVILSEAGIIKAGELENFKWRYLRREYSFLNKVESLEGFLFPDTYQFSQFSPIEIVVKEFLNNFSEQGWPLLSKEGDSFYRYLKVASLLEKEAPFSNDRRIISNVIYKRIKLGMPIQIDASIAYAKCEKKFITCDAKTRRLSKKDFALDNLFNTYLNKDLPPTPIANPGLDAIRAALNPMRASYLYYISDPRTKKTIFANTLDEHNENRVKYLIRN